jgi:hypothetical protein
MSAGGARIASIARRTGTKRSYNVSILQPADEARVAIGKMVTVYGYPDGQVPKRRGQRDHMVRVR